MGLERTTLVQEEVRFQPGDSEEGLPPRAHIEVATALESKVIPIPVSHRQNLGELAIQGC
jgi:hypothetical protein